MHTIIILGQLAGGIGLFLLAMKYITDGNWSNRYAGQTHSDYGFNARKGYGRRLQIRVELITQLVETVGQCIVKTQKLPLIEKDASTLSKTLRITHYLAEATNLVMGVVGIRTAGEALADKSLLPDLIGYTRAVINCLVKIELWSNQTSLDQVETSFAPLEEDYQNLKERLLRSGATGRIGPRDLDHLLDLLSLLHRVLERHLKALRILIPLLEERELTALTAQQRRYKG